MDGYIKKSDAVDVIVKYPYNISGKTATAIKMIEGLPDADVVPKSEVEMFKIKFDILKSTVTHKEEQAYNKGYADAKADILEKLQADIARDEILAAYGDELFEGRIAGFKAIMNYLNSEGEDDRS